MPRLNRRKFGLMAGGGLMGLAAPKAGFAAPGEVPVMNKREADYRRSRILIVGGGEGGMAALKALSSREHSWDLTLIDPVGNSKTTLFSKQSGPRADRAELVASRNWKRLLGKESNFIRSWVASIDRQNKTLKLSDGKKLNWDYLILAPGLSFRYDSYPGYDLQTQYRMPHGWNNAKQIGLLRKRIADISQGGTFMMVAASGLSSMRHAVEQRIVEIDDYFSHHNPGARLLVLEGDDNRHWFNPLARQISRTTSKRVIWVPWQQHGGIQAIHGRKPEIKTVSDDFKADAVSVIPRQKSADISHICGLTLDDWVPVNTGTMASVYDDSLYVIGDALGTAGDHLPLATQVERMIDAIQKSAA